MAEKGWQYIRETFIRAAKKKKKEKEKTDRLAVNPPRRDSYYVRTFLSPGGRKGERERERERPEAIPTNKNRSDRFRRASEESNAAPRVSADPFPRRSDFQSYAPERRGSGRSPVFGGLIFKAAANPRARGRFE